MLNIDSTKLNEVWGTLELFLKSGLVAGDFWDVSRGMAVSSKNSDPAFVALFNQLLPIVNSTLEGSGYAKFGKFFVIKEKQGYFVVINHGSNLMQGFLLDESKINLGLLFNVAIPRALKMVNEAFAAANGGFKTA